MEFKGTKGEWTYSPMKGKEKHCFMAQVWDAEGKSLATIDSHYGEVESTENAKLISAAPDLLKFAQSFIKDFEGDYMMRDGSIVDDPSTLLLVNYEQAKEVVKKAIG